MPTMQQGSQIIMSRDSSAPGPDTRIPSDDDLKQAVREGKPKS